jgi:hypothetical protein
MTIYLDADCVLDALVRAQFIKPEKWKRAGSKKYIARFYHASTNGTLCFEIYAEGDVHKLSAIYIKNLEKRYDVDLSLIVNRCAL